MLEGIRVVDCSIDIAGPYCTKLLADAGADVVKVEPSTGDPLRAWGSGALFDFLNTSKRSVTVAQLGERSVGRGDGDRALRRVQEVEQRPRAPGA